MSFVHAAVKIISSFTSQAGSGLAVASVHSVSSHTIMKLSGLSHTHIHGQIHRHTSSAFIGGLW